MKFIWLSPFPDAGTCVDLVRLALDILGKQQTHAGPAKPEAAGARPEVRSAKSDILTSDPEESDSKLSLAARRPVPPLVTADGCDTVSPGLLDGCGCCVSMGVV